MHSKHETNEKENNPQIRLESASNNKGKKMKFVNPKNFKFAKSLD
jgi:hypothetical protein